MTKQEFITKYGDVKVKFNSYYKFTFTFKSTLPDGKILYCDCGSNSDDIYRMEVQADFEESVNVLDPYAGRVYDGTKEIESFYDL